MSALRSTCIKHTVIILFFSRFFYDIPFCNLGLGFNVIQYHTLVTRKHETWNINWKENRNEKEVENNQSPLSLTLILSAFCQDRWRWTLFYSFFIFILLFFSFSFKILFLEQLGLGVISHAVTSVTNWWRSHETDHGRSRRN